MPAVLTDRTVFFVSDGTGHHGRDAGTQRADAVRAPALPAATPALRRLRRQRRATPQCASTKRASATASAPIVFSTLVNPAISRRAARRHRSFRPRDVRDVRRAAGARARAEVDAYHRPLPQRSQSTQRTTRTASRRSTSALAHDDGQSAKGLAKADVILVGVSRSGKTPTSLYLAMQYGVKAANYPLIPDDFERNQLPSALPPHKDKIFGLSICTRAAGRGSP